MEPDLNTDGFHRPVLLSIFVFDFSFFITLLFGSVRKMKLALGRFLSARKNHLFYSVLL